MKPFQTSSAPVAARGKTRSVVENLEGQLAVSEQMRRMIMRVHAAEDQTSILAAATDELLDLFDVERLGIYAIDPERRELYSEVLDPGTLAAVREIRLPIESNSIAGFVAQNRVTVNVKDAHDAKELEEISPKLRFDASWDEKTGFRTRQILAIPLLTPAKMVAGVLQLINPRAREVFTREDEDKLRELSETLGLALWRQTQRASRPTKRRGRFDLLVAEGKVEQAALDEVTAQAEAEQRPVEFLLMEKLKLAKKDVGRALAEYYSCPFFDYDITKPVIPSEILGGINPNYLKTSFWVPLSVDADNAEVLIDDPHAAGKLQDVRRVFPGRTIRCVVGLRSDIYRVIQQIGSGGSGPGGAIGDILGSLGNEPGKPASIAPTDMLEQEVVDESSNAIIRLSNQVIVDAYRARASDIHVEPRPGQREAVIRIRVDGVCREYLRVPAAYRQALTARFKVMARLDIAERRLPQDGKIRIRVEDREIELRVATIPTAGIDNEDVVLRILTAQEPLPLDRLQMTDRNLRELRAILGKPYGIFLCVGPTGSGKTTTLHAGLASINQPVRKIWTVEDPVEISQDGLRQVQVNNKAGLTFPAALRAFLRADPDVIMVGEMRDRETATIAIEASLTGHLVLSTLHTNSASETITRLLEMGIEPFTFGDALLGVISQRLVRRICERCREEFVPERDLREELARGYGDEAAFAELGVDWDTIKLARGKGCEACGNTGYRGRVAIHELLVATDEIKGMIRRSAPAFEIHELARTQGMTSLLQDGVLKILAGHTDRPQVWATAMR